MNNETNLPKTNFPMRGNLPELQKKVLEKNPWNSTNISFNKDTVILHDGPPYANGNIHVGHAYNKILKDVFYRFLNSNKKTVHYSCGWDCHGLPIELAANKEKNEETGLDKFRTYALHQLNIQKNQFNKLGISINDYYKTMDSSFEDIELSAFQDLVKKGFIKTAFKPVHWCWSCKTSLAESELEYKKITDNSVYVLFPSVEEPNLSFMTWTTTPWTLKGNKAIAINKNIDYVIVFIKFNDIEKGVVVSKWFADNILKVPSVFQQKVAGEYLIEKSYFDCFNEEKEPRQIFHADYVTENVGTGFVHIAPSCGKEDYLVYSENFPGSLVGSYTDQNGKVGDLFYKKANKVFIDDLNSKNNLFKEEKITHDYPHCWRCKNELIQHATSQVFIDYKTKQELILEQAETINFFPAKAKTRFKSFLTSRTEWCVSRQRTWGVPIPQFECLNCNSKNQFDLKVSSVEGWRSNSYFPSCTKCNSENTKKYQDILDVWFDSGLTYKTLPKLRSDFVIEGSDQHRGWFQSSHIISCLLEEKTCLTNVVSHGFVLDENKRKMSKSEGNVVDPLKVIETNGIDILRLWAISQEIGEDVTIGKELLDQQGQNYRKIRNTLKYLLSNLYDLPKELTVQPNNREVTILNELQNSYISCFEKFEFNNFYKKLMVYIDNLSAGYINDSKKILYENNKNAANRREVQATFNEILITLVPMLEVMIPITIYEFKSYMKNEISSEE